MSNDLDQINVLAEPLTLPSGVKLKNRIVKAALEEMLSKSGGGDPNEAHYKLYSKWAEGGYGMVISGNVTFRDHLGTPRDIVIPDPKSPTYAASVAAFTRLAKAAHGTNPNTAPAFVMQICHVGRQSIRGGGRSLSTQPLAPSAVPVQTGKDVLNRFASKLLFQIPKEMTQQDIKDVVDGFVQCSQLAKEAGYDGVQLHVSHGYLLSQFLSPHVNLRTDKYGGSAKARMTLLFEIIDGIRAVLPFSSRFALGVKLNSSDYVKGGLTEADALDNVKWLAEHGGLDFIEISGGTYESPVMLGDSTPASGGSTVSKSTAQRESFFIGFAKEATRVLRTLPSSSLPTPAPALMVTGGFRTRAGMSHAVSSGSTDMVGLGRPACADPLIAKKILDPKLTAAEGNPANYKVRISPVVAYILSYFNSVGAGVNTIYHTIMMAQIAKRGYADAKLSFLAGVWDVWIPQTRVYLLLTLLSAGLFYKLYQ